MRIISFCLLLCFQALLATILFSLVESATPSAAAITGMRTAAGTFHETVLNTTNVNSRNFGFLFSRNVTGLPYSQVLFLPNVTVPSSSHASRNLIFVTTMANYVYAFDADDPTESKPIWSRRLGNAAPSTVKFHAIWMPLDGVCQPQIGILSTPVIDDTTGVMYVISWSEDGKEEWNFRFHALNVSTGEHLSGFPTVLEAQWVANETTTIKLNPKMQMQRPGLALRDGIVWAAFASFCIVQPYYGWVLGIEARTGKVVRTWNSNPAHGKSGIWKSGQALAMDPLSGDLIVNIGDGILDPAYHSFGNSIVRLSTKDADERGQMRVKGYWSPVYWKTLLDADSDFGVSGVMLIPNTTLAVGGSKGWAFAKRDAPKLFLFDTSRLNNSNSDLSTISKTSTSYPYNQGALLQIVRVTSRIYGHIHGVPLYWKSPTDESFVYVWPEADAVIQFKIKLFDDGLGKFNTTQFARGSERLAEFTMPGGFLSISVDDNNSPGSAILWASHPKNGCDANQKNCPGILRAYDAQNVGIELWNSWDQESKSDDQPRWVHAKFVPPTIVNGRVYIPTHHYDRIEDPECYIRVYGLRESQHKDSLVKTAQPSPKSAVVSAFVSSQSAFGLISILILCVTITF